MQKKLGFTLIELLIVMSIMGILTVILFRTYSTISQVSFRLQQEKNVYTQMMDVLQPLQSFADASTVDYSQYMGLSGTQGVVDTLFLTGDQGALRVFTSGACLPMTSVITGINQPCILYVERSGQLLALTNPAVVSVSQVSFKIIPWQPVAELFSGTAAGWDLMHQIAQPGFWIFFQLWSSSYGSRWERQVSIPVQQFFSLGS